MPKEAIMKSKNNLAQAVKNRIDVQMDRLIDHVENIESDLLECRGTINWLTAENERLTARLEELESSSDSTEV